MAEQGMESLVFPDEDGWMLITREHAIAATTNVARQHRYALAIHGSHVRDVDLIAVPWTEDAAKPEILLEAITAAIPGVIVGEVEVKPHGREGWTIYPRYALGADLWYIDLSIMPLLSDHNSGRQE